MEKELTYEDLMNLNTLDILKNGSYKGRKTIFDRYEEVYGEEELGRLFQEYTQKEYGGNGKGVKVPDIDLNFEIDR